MARDKRVKEEKQDLLGIIRQQSKQIKHLKKELARANKTITRTALTDPDTNLELDTIQDAALEDHTLTKCSKCKSKAAIITLGPIMGTILACSNKECGFRERKKNVK